MNFSRVLEKYRTEIMGFLVGIVLILAGLIFPQFIPDNPSGPPGFQDATWLRSLISLLLIGMGIVSFLWLFIIHRFMLRRRKKDIIY